MAVATNLTKSKWANNQRSLQTEQTVKKTAQAVKKKIDLTLSQQKEKRQRRWMWFRRCLLITSCLLRLNGTLLFFFSADISFQLGSSLFPSTVTGGTCHRMGAVAPWRKNSLKNCSFEGYVKGAKYAGGIAAVGHKISKSRTLGWCKERYVCMPW